jgi:flagellar biosynthesis protein FlhB
MTLETVVAIVGVIVGCLQTWIVFVLQGIKQDLKDLKDHDIKDIWKRMYSHYHEIECNNPDCRPLRTGDVIIPREGA